MQGAPHIIAGSPVEEIENDLQKWMDDYNNTRTHAGKYCFGKTPKQTFDESKHLAFEKMLDSQKQATEKVVR